MTKNDLTTGMVVEYQNGKRRLVINAWAGHGTILFGNKPTDRWTHLDNFNDDLTHKTKSCLDIVKVYHYPIEDIHCDLSKLTDDDLIWSADDDMPDVVEAVIIPAIVAPVAAVPVPAPAPAPTPVVAKITFNDVVDDAEYVVKITKKK
jgi:hypothetical protein